MSDAPPHHVLPQWVDARKFAIQGVALAGDIRLDTLSRLVAGVASVGEGVISAKLRFDLDSQRHRLLTGELSTAVTVTCQRCMEPLVIPLEAQMSLAMVASEDEARQLPKSLEPWFVDPEATEADLYRVIEDELLLSLPMVAYHDYQCIDESLYSSADADIPQETEVDNPFKVLEGLKGSASKDKGNEPNQ